MDHTYWLKQTKAKPLYADIEWSKPERRDQSGKLAIIGGNKLGFASVAENYQTALETGAGEVRVLLPDCLRKAVPAAMTDVIFADCTPSGSLSRDALPELRATAEWADSILLIGDAGRNSETALAYETFISSYAGPLIATRDAIDLVMNDPNLLIDRNDTLIVASFAQVQKLFGGVYYPKILTFSMQLLQLVESLHKFTITYPCTIVTLHQNTILIASGGQVVTQPWEDAMLIWRGNVATRAAAYWLWNRDLLIPSVAASIA